MDPQAAISSITSALPLVRALVEERDRLKRAAIELDLTERLLQAKADLLQVMEASIAQQREAVVLQERVRDLEAAQREKERYSLARLGAVGQTFAYRLRPPAELSERVDEPEHFVCQPCFDSGRKAVLNLGGHYAVCPVCKTSILIEPLPKIQLRPRSPQRNAW